MSLCLLPVSDPSLRVECYICKITCANASDLKFYTDKDPKSEDLQRLDPLIQRIRRLGEKQICETCACIKMHDHTLTPEQFDGRRFITLQNMGQAIAEEGFATIADSVLHQPARSKALLGKLACKALDHKNSEIATALAKKLTEGSLSEKEREWIAPVVAEIGYTEGLKTVLDLGEGVSLRKRGAAAAKAAKKGHAKCLQLLLNDPGIDQPGKHLSVISAIDYGHAECLKLLLDSGVNDQQKNNEAVGAARLGRTESLKLLLDAGIDEKARGDAACSAVREGHVECLKLLLKAGISEQYKQGCALAARKGGHKECLQLLLDARVTIGPKYSLAALPRQSAFWG